MEPQKNHPVIYQENLEKRFKLNENAAKMLQNAGTGVKMILYSFLHRTSTET